MLFPDGTGGTPALLATGHWKLVIDATMFVTGAVVNVWTGTKLAGNDPVGQYIRVSGCDLLAALTVAEA